MFYCTKSGNDIEVQTNIIEISGKNTEKKSSTDACVGVSSDNNLNFLEHHGFHGFKSLEKSSTITGMAGVSFQVFSHLLSFIPERCNIKVSRENRLLMFLTKMKLRISFSAIGIIFNIHRTTASQIFTSLGQIVCRNE